MFSRDAIRAMEEGLSDLELSSDDEGPIGSASDDDDDEDADPSWVIMNDNCLPEVPSTSEDTVLQYNTPNHSIRWRHKEIVNTIAAAWFSPIAIDPRIESPVDYYNRYIRA